MKSPNYRGKRKGCRDHVLRDLELAVEAAPGVNFEAKLVAIVEDPAAPTRLKITALHCESNLLAAKILADADG